MCDRESPYLTVEEAARLLRIGRTKAYAMTREWRQTGGRSGLPVVDLGDVLRVPRAALEQFIHAALTAPGPHQPAGAPLANRTPRRRHERQRHQSQPELFSNPDD